MTTHFIILNTETLKLQLMTGHYLQLQGSVRLAFFPTVSKE